MGRGPAVAVCLAALVVGIGTGHFLIPDPFHAPPPPAKHRVRPTAEAKPAPATYASTPPTEADLVSVKAFHRAGLSVTVYPQNGNTSPGNAVSSCTGERTVGARTLGDITGHDPLVLGTWDEPATTETASEVVAMAESPDGAATAADRLLAAQTTCQHEPVSHWVYGRTQRRQLSDGVWAAWMGMHPGSQNTTGQAPADAAPCGGLAVVRNGQRFGLLEVFMCTDARQLRTLAVAAATRLG